MECLAAGVMSSMHSQNAKASAAVTSAQQAIQHETWPLMVDPQTGTITTILSTVQMSSLWSQVTRQRLIKPNGLKGCMLKAVSHTCPIPWPLDLQKGANTLLPSSLRMHMCTGRPWPEVAELIFYLCLMHAQAAVLNCRWGAAGLASSRPSRLVPSGFAESRLL